MAFSGVRSSWDMFARNCDLCWLATSSCSALLLELVEEAGVLDGEHRLAGERLEQVDDLGRERARASSGDDQAADDVVLAQQRDGQQRADARPEQHVAQTGSEYAPALGDVRRSGRARASTASLAGRALAQV